MNLPSEPEPPATVPARTHRGLHPGAGPLLPRWHPATLVAFAWAVRAARSVRSSSVAGLDAIRVPAPPPGLPDGARRGVLAALRRSGATCLVEAVVRQRWDRAHGRDRQLVIGVTPPAQGFTAHAWLDGDPPCCSGGFTELTRR